VHTQELGRAMTLQTQLSISGEDDKPAIVVQPQSVNPRPESAKSGPREQNLQNTLFD
jgi:hypothetical protein